MPVRWECEQCSRVRILPDQPNLAALRCIRCGCRTGRFLTETDPHPGPLPEYRERENPLPAPLPGPEYREEAESGRRATSDDDLARALAQSAAEARRSDPVRRRPRSNSNLPTYIALAVGLVLLVGVGLFLLPRPGRELTWEQQNVATIERLLSEAEQAEAAGDARQAFDRYEALFEFIQNRKFVDRELVARLNDAGQNRRRLGEELIRRRYDELAAGAPADSPSGPGGLATGPGSSGGGSREEGEGPSPRPSPGVPGEGGPSPRPSPGVSGEGESGPRSAPGVPGEEEPPNGLQFPGGPEFTVSPGRQRRPSSRGDLPAPASPLEGMERPADPEAARRLNIELLIGQGMAALVEREWEAALETLSDGLQLLDPRLPETQADPLWVDSMQGLVVANVHLGRFPAAGALFQEGGGLARAMQRSPTRELVVNRAIVDMVQRFQIMRAVRSLREYLVANPDPLDEELANLLGTAIALAEQRPPQNRRVLDEAIAFYEQYVQRIEAQRPGMRRWGVQWISQREYSTITRQRDERLRAYRSAESRLEAAQAELRAASVLMYGRRPRNITAGQAEQRWQRARDQVEAAGRAAEAAWAQVPQPPWLETAEPLLPPAAQRLGSATADGQWASGGGAPAGGGGGPAGDDGEQIAAAPPPEPGPVDEAPVSPVGPSIPIVPAAGGGGASAGGGEVGPPPPSRRVVRYAAGFAVDRFRLVTAAGPLENATRVFIEDPQGRTYPARVAARGEQFALLEVEGGEVGQSGLVAVSLAEVVAGGAVRCVAIPTPSVFNPVVETLEGTAAAPREGQPWRVALSKHPRLAGSPLLDAAGEVVGVVMAAREDAPSALPAIPVEGLRAFLVEQGWVPMAGRARGGAVVYQVMAVH